MIYTFRKPGFNKRQSSKLRDANTRSSILVDCGLNNDMKVAHLHSQKDYTLLPLYLQILFNLDVDSESWVISKLAFESWFKGTFNVNNRFDIKSRIDWLASNGFIEFSSDEVSTNKLKLSPNNSKVSSNKVKQIPLEMPENQAGVISIINQTNQHYPPTPQGDKSRFDEFWKIYPNKKGKSKARSTWEREKLDRMADQVIAGVKRYAASPDWQKENGKYIPHGSTFINKKLWEDEVTNEPVLIKHPSRIALLLAARAIYNRFEPEWVIQKEELETFENMPDSIFHKGKRLVIDEFEAVS